MPNIDLGGWLRPVPKATAGRRVARWPAGYEARVRAIRLDIELASERATTER